MKNRALVQARAPFFQVRTSFRKLVLELLIFHGFLRLRCTAGEKPLLDGLEHFIVPFRSIRRPPGTPRDLPDSLGRLRDAPGALRGPFGVSPETSRGYEMEQ